MRIDSVFYEHNAGSMSILSAYKCILYMRLLGAFCAHSIGMHNKKEKFID